jgi:starch phosphorylase
MEFQSHDEPENTSTFSGMIPCRASGQHGFAIRVMPKHADLVDPYEPGMILWESKGN